MIPPWLTTFAHGLFVLLAGAASLYPLLLVVVLVAEYFVCRYRGLVKRTSSRWAVFVADDALHIERDGVRRSLPLRDLSRARFVRNDNWTESRLLEDALGLRTASGRELARLPESTKDLDVLVAELTRRGVAASRSSRSTSARRRTSIDVRARPPGLGGRAFRSLADSLQGVSRRYSRARLVAPTKTTSGLVLRVSPAHFWFAPPLGEYRTG